MTKVNEIRITDKELQLLKDSYMDLHGVTWDSSRKFTLPSEYFSWGDDINSDFFNEMGLLLGALEDDKSEELTFGKLAEIVRSTLETLHPKQVEERGKDSGRPKSLTSNQVKSLKNTLKLAAKEKVALYKVLTCDFLDVVTYAGYISYELAHLDWVQRVRRDLETMEDPNSEFANYEPFLYKRRGTSYVTAVAQWRLRIGK